MSDLGHVITIGESCRFCGSSKAHIPLADGAFLVFVNQWRGHYCRPPRR
jgi:hypothetical protein